MRYVILFDDENTAFSYIFFSGLLLDPDKEIQYIEHPKFKRFSQEMLEELMQSPISDFEEKYSFIHLDENDEPFFNQEAYELSLLENTESDPEEPLH